LLQLVGTGPDNGDPATGGATLLHAGSIAVGIGAGASLGIFLGRPIVDQVRGSPAAATAHPDPGGRGCGRLGG
jgi:hypothetical protein